MSRANACSISSTQENSRLHERRERRRDGIRRSDERAARALEGSMVRSTGSLPLSIRLARFALPFILLGFSTFFSIVKTQSFFTLDNLRGILATHSVLAILALATMLPLIIGEFDLSVGANLGLAAILVTGLPSREGQGFAVAIAAALAASTTVGLINGLLVARGGINAFITTLGTGTVVTGGILWYTGGNVFYQNIPPTLLTIGSGDAAGIPYPVVLLAATGLILWYILEHTPLGRYLYALGGSRDAARLAGVRVQVLTVCAFTACGFLAGMAGVLESATLGSGNPTVGPDFLLPAFAAAFLGATAIKPGTYNVLGTLFAVFTLQTGIVGLQLLGVPFFIEPIFNGVALIVAVGATRLLSREAL